MLRIAQNLSLQQKMAPQLIQSLQLLQMSTLELELEIKQQMEINPLLEETLDAEEGEEQQAEEKEEILVKLVNKVVQVVAVDLMLMAEVKETYHQYLLLKAIRGELQDQDRTQR